MDRRYGEWLYEMVFRPLQAIDRGIPGAARAIDQAVAVGETVGRPSHNLSDGLTGRIAPQQGAGV